MGDVWSAMGDPTRRKILTLLQKEDLNAGQIAMQFDMAKPSVSHHLNILKNAGLVYAQKSGQNVIYSINTSVLEDVLKLVSGWMDRGDMA